MDNNFYILDGHSPVKALDIATWTECYKSKERIVKHTKISEKLEVITVFTGVDLNLDGNGGNNPILFETRVFGGEKDGFCEGYSTWEEAEAGHDEVIEFLFD